MHVEHVLKQDRPVPQAYVTTEETSPGEGLVLSLFLLSQQYRLLKRKRTMGKEERGKGVGYAKKHPIKHHSPVSSAAAIP